MNKWMLLFITAATTLLLLFVLTLKAAAVKILFPILILCVLGYIVYLFFNVEGEKDEETLD